MKETEAVTTAKGEELKDKTSKLVGAEKRIAELEDNF